MTHTLYHGDCLDILPTLPAQSVDAIIADPPYGTTACKWDSVIPLDAMWRELKRVIKPRGAVVLFAAQPFTSALVMSNAGWFRYELIWNKPRPMGFLDANRKPLRVHENLVVFAEGNTTYNPQMVDGAPYRKVNGSADRAIHLHGGIGAFVHENSGTRFPRSVLEFSNSNAGSLHPTQKPVELLRYLVRTYTNPGETVLDFCYGSGTTGVAALMEGRHFIGVELDAGYFDIARKRIESVQPALMEAAD